MQSRLQKFFDKYLPFKNLTELLNTQYEIAWNLYIIKLPSIYFNMVVKIQYMSIFNTLLILVLTNLYMIFFVYYFK